MPILFLRDSEVVASLSATEALESQRSAYLAVVDGRGGLLTSAHAGDAASEGLVYVRTGMVAATGLAVKAGMVKLDNRGRGAASVSAVVMLFDPGSGEPVACMNGAALTLLRTAAGLAVAADALAPVHADSLGVLGSGPQAEHTVAMVSAVRPVQRVTVWSPTRAHLDGLVSRLQDRLEADVVAGSSPRQAVEGHHIVAACTSSREPVVHGAWLAVGQTVLTMGSVEPDRCEVDLDATRAGRTFVDTLAQTLRQCGPVVEALRAGVRRADDLTEVGAVLAGSRPGRVRAEDIVIFHSVGLGHQDATAAWTVYRNAKAAGLGVVVDL